VRTTWAPPVGGAEVPGTLAAGFDGAEGKGSGVDAASGFADTLSGVRVGASIRVLRRFPKVAIRALSEYQYEPRRMAAFQNAEVVSSND